jgi:hypothetical protein
MTSAAEYLQARLEADPDLDLEGTACVAEVLLVAARLHGQAGRSREQAETLLATYRAKFAAWRAWSATHEDLAPGLVAELHTLLLARSRRHAPGPTSD